MEAHLTWPADIGFLTTYFYLEIMTDPTLLNHVMYLLLIYLNLSTNFILWTLFLQLFEPVRCDNFILADFTSCFNPAEFWVFWCSGSGQFLSAVSNVPFTLQVFKHLGLQHLFARLSFFFDIPFQQPCAPLYILFWNRSVWNWSQFLLSSVPAYNLSVLFIWNVTFSH